MAFGAMFYAMSVMLTDSAAGSEFSTTSLSAANGGFVLVGGGLAFVIGRRADRVGVRSLTIAGFAIGAAGLVAFGRATEPWHIVAASWLLMGPAAGLTFYEPAFIAVDQWFDPRHRARALAVLTLIGGLAGPLFLPGTERMVAAAGWRTTTLILAGTMLAAGAIDAVALPRGIPRSGAGGTAPPRAVKLIRDRRFVLFTLAMALSFGAFQTVFFHRIAVFEEAGFAVATVTLWAAASSLLSFPGRYAGPYLAERLGGIRIYSAATVLAAVAVLAMIGTGTWRMPVHFVGFGLTFGAMLPIRAVVMAHWYSGPGYGRVMGAQWSFAAVAGALMPALAGLLRDRAGDYAPALVGVAVLFVLAAAAALLSERREAAPG
ncbi:MAG: MFS transporter [Acidimicrobiia bacterium]|nr:MFS transporter [Acidimicrobiia bacterium]